MNLLEESIKNSPIIKKGSYNYIVHPLTDGIPEIRPDLLDEVTEKMKGYLEKLGKIDKIVTIEAMGIPLATSLSMKLNIPFTIIRKRKYGLPGEISVEQVTGYSESTLFINGLKEGEKVVIVDDVISTGGTIKAILESLLKMGIEVRAVITAIEKGSGGSMLRNSFDIPIISLVRIEVSENEVEIKR